MRLGIKLLNSDATVNSFRTQSMLRVARGETLDILIQLVDLDQNGLRYVPAAGSTVQINLPRNLQVVGSLTNTRTSVDHSISAPATMPFALDGSVWKVSLSAAQTASDLISTNLQAVVTEAGSVKIATLIQALKIIDGQEF